MNQNRNANKLSVGMTGLIVGGWFAIKLEGVCGVYCKENKGGRRNG